MPLRYTVTRYYPDKTGRIVNERSATFDSESSATKYLRLLRETIKRQDDGSLAGLAGPDGKTIKVD